VCGLESRRSDLGEGGEDRSYVGSIFSFEGWKGGENGCSTRVLERNRGSQVGKGERKRKDEKKYIGKVIDWAHRLGMWPKIRTVSMWPKSGRISCMWPKSGRIPVVSFFFFFCNFLFFIFFEFLIFNFFYF
jgi:hypothetical protein